VKPGALHGGVVEREREREREQESGRNVCGFLPALTLNLESFKSIRRFL